MARLAAALVFPIWAHALVLQGVTSPHSSASTLGSKEARQSPVQMRYFGHELEGTAGGLQVPFSCANILGGDDRKMLSEWAQCGVNSTGCADNFTPFLILFGGQTGTTHLVEDIFLKHPEIFFMHEANHGCTLDILRSGKGNWAPRPALGTKSQELDLTALLDVHTRMRFIHITRLNPIEWGLSKIHKEDLRECTGGSDCIDSSDICSWCNDKVNAPRRINITNLKKEVETRVYLEDKRKNIVSILASRNFPVLHVSFEELVADEESQLKRIFAFLGVSPIHEQERSTVVRHSAPSLRASFTNWGEVTAAFCGTKFEHALGLKSNESCGRPGASEVDSLKKSKAVLSGADFSLVQADSTMSS